MLFTLKNSRKLLLCTASIVIKNKFKKFHNWSNYDTMQSKHYLQGNAYQRLIFCLCFDSLFAKQSKKQEKERPACFTYAKQSIRK